ncbi:MAG: restriction endonuclease [Methylococcaceae bacterium]
MSNQCVSNTLSPEEISEKKHAARERIEEIKREKEQVQLERKKGQEDFDYRQAAKQKELEREKERLVNFVCELVKLHLDKLLLKKKQLVRVDDYGNEDVSGFAKELNYFIDKTIRTKIDIPYDKEELVWDTLVDLIFSYENNTPPKVKNLDDVSPIDFEHQCAEILNQTGWTARVTQASGDQGIDVIATYGNVKAVFQVKKYSQPVGNSAVQEIIAGKAFEQAHVAAVVTNSTFTASAKKLANATGVFLLHYSELPDFAEELGLVETE